MLQAGFDFPMPDVEDQGEPKSKTRNPEPDAPRFLGSYELLEEIGRGGMGIVYVAEQKEPVRRRVAIKIIKLGMDTREVIARFEAERQALALMDHPNIARIFEAGATETGRPYFVMELVRGVKITDYCDQHKLSTGERLTLFVQVCRAVQHAHQKGIIHRDIKPSNILVTLQDGMPVPKVIDFGVAKATGPSLTEKTVFTAFEQIIGTPAYMSPEQTELGGLDIDTRSDIYSLGVLLYELLTGRTPFDSEELLRAGLDAMRRKIREEEPPRPSTRLTSLTNEELTNVARRRQAEPPKLISLVRGDLDWIVMKALEKERSRRYETTNGLATDVQRYLSDEAIVARPAGKVYRFQKLVRRNKLAFAAAGAVAAALIIGTAISVWQAARAVRAGNEAKANEQKAHHITSFLTNMFESIDPAVAKQREITVREVLDEAGRTVATAFSNEPASELIMRRTLLDIYIKLGRDDQALPHAEAALLLAKSAGRNKDDAEVAAALNDVAGCLNALGRSAEALPGYEEALAMYQRLYRGDHSDVVASLNYVAFCLDALGRSADALPKLEAALAMSQRLHKGDDQDVAESLNNLASCLVSLGRPGDALPKYQAALDMRQRIYKDDNPSTVTSLDNVATCLDALGRGSEALTNYEKALAMAQRLYKGDHPYLATSLNNVAACLLDMGRPADAMPKYEAALAMRQRIFQGDHHYVATSLNNLGLCLKALGRLPEALPKFEAGLAMFQRLYQGDHPLVATSLDNLAICLEALANSDDALPKYQQALEMRQRIYKADHPSVTRSLTRFGSCLNDLGRSAEALPRLEAALAMSQRLYHGDHPETGRSSYNLAACLSSLGRSDEAVQKYSEAIAMFQRLAAAQPANTAFQANLAVAHEKMGDLLANQINAAEAKQHYQKGLKITEAILGTNASPQVSQLHLSLRAKLGLEQPELAILAVAPRSLARQLGLRPGDVLVSYAGQPIATVDQLNSLSGSIKGNEIEFEIRRDTEPLKFNVKEGSLGIRCEYRSVAKKADP
jgi:serine/threonine protein kinase